MRRLTVLIPLSVAAAALTGCSNSQYFHISTAPAAAFTGSNCGNPSIAQSYQGVQNSTEWGIYAAPNGNNTQYMLEGAEKGELLIAPQSTAGTSQTSYTFTGTEVQDTKGAPGASEVTYTIKDTVSMVVNAAGTTGTFAQEIACHSSDGKTCATRGGVGGQAGATNGQDFDCSTSEAFVGTAIPNVTQFHNVTSPGNGAQ